MSFARQDKGSERVQKVCKVAPEDLWKRLGDFACLLGMIPVVGMQKK